MKVLLVDDDPALVEVVAEGIGLLWRDVAVLPAHGGEQALRLFAEHAPDVVVLDVSMPVTCGFGVLAAIRRASDVPVVMLTGRTSETDQVRGLELGADEYVLKPFSLPVLVARIRAVLRRTRTPLPARATPDFAAGPLTVDFELRRVRLDGRPVRLSPAEYRLLHHLVRNAGRFLTQDALLEGVWPAEWGASANNLKALVNRLRAKIEPEGSGLRFLENRRGVGYRLVVPEKQPARPTPIPRRDGSLAARGA